MFLAKKPSQDDLDKYYALVKTELIDSINAIKAGDKLEACKGFLKKNLEKIIKGTPAELVKFNDKLLTHYRISEHELDVYREHRRKDQRKVAGDIAAAVKKVKKVNKALSDIFNYNKIISCNKDCSYALAKLNGTNTCVYCNRIYTLTIFKEGEEDEGLSRPQFDHYFAKALYPLLALSYYNLIPSCYVCNSGVKGEKKMSLDTHLHPYIDGEDINYPFSFIYDETHDTFLLDIEVPEGNEKAENTLRDFRTLELYKPHIDMELRELYNLTHKYPNSHSKVMIDLFDSEDVLDRNRIYELLFGIDSKLKSFHNRPFSKFRYDILEQLRIEHLTRLANKS